MGAATAPCVGRNSSGSAPSRPMTARLKNARRAMGQEREAVVARGGDREAPRPFEGSQSPNEDVRILPAVRVTEAREAGPFVDRRGVASDGHTRFIGKGGTRRMAPAGHARKS